MATSSRFNRSFYTWLAMSLAGSVSPASISIGDFIIPSTIIGDMVQNRLFDTFDLAHSILARLRYIFVLQM